MKTNQLCVDTRAKTGHLSCLKIPVLVFLLSAFILPLSAGSAEQQLVSLDLKNASAEETVGELRSGTRYRFAVMEGVLASIPRKDYAFSNAQISTVLSHMVSGTDIEWIEEEGTIILKRKEDRVVQRKQVTISGSVTDIDGNPMPGAAVINKENNKGMIVGSDGSFQLTAETGARIEVSFLGYETYIFYVEDDRTNYHAVLYSGSFEVEKVIISTGYQNISKERSAGSYSVVRGSDIKDKAIIRGSVLESLEGAAPGLNINLGSEGDKFLVRGVTSINSNRTPLFVVDGVPVPANMIEGMLGGSDVQNVTVLKDATAASIWGAQAANGVVVITTKSGSRSGGVDISYNGSFTFTGKPDYSYLDYMDSRMFIKSAIEVFDPEGNEWDKISKSLWETVLPHEIPLYKHYLDGKAYPLAQRNAELERLSGLDGRKAYEKYMMSNAWLTNHSVSISGGSDKQTFYISTTYQGQQGSNKNNTNEYKINARENINLTRWMNLDLSLNASYGKDKSHLALFAVDDFSGATGLTNLPYAVFHDANGNELSFTEYLINESLRTEAEEISGINLDYYPLQDFKNTTQETIAKNIRANAGLTINLLEGLRYEGRFSYYTSNGTTETYTPTDSYNVRLDRVYATNMSGESFLPSSGGYFRVRNANEDSYTVRNQFSYDNTFGDGLHQVTGLLGSEITQNKSGSYTSTLRGYDKQTMQSIFFDDYSLNVDGVSDPVLRKLDATDNYFDSERYLQGETTNRFVSFYANGAYTYNYRYSFNASVRVDQSNLFGSDKSVQFKPIWSVGGIWNLGTEQFLDDANWLDLLHLRASFGYSGNSPSPGQGGPYDIIRANSSPSYSEFGLGYEIVTPANKKLTWEKTRTVNIGISYSILNSRLTGSIDLYDKKTTDLLAYIPVDPSTGYTSVLQNIGTMKNKGFEIALGSRNFVSHTFMWNTDVTLSYNKNKLVEMYFDPPLTPAGQVTERYAEGHPVNALFAYRWAGLDPSDGAARVYNENGEIVRLTDGINDVSAVRYMGTTTPPWSGSLSNTLRYKHFELSFMFIGNFGHKMRNDTYYQYDTRLTSNIHKDFDKRWRKPGDEAFTDIPSFYYKNESFNRSGGTTLFGYSDIGILNASYIKLREISVAYNLPSNVCRALGTRAMKVRLQANNLWTIAFNGEGIDPEAFSLRSGARYDRYKPSVSGSLTIDF